MSRLPKRSSPLASSLACSAGRRLAACALVTLALGCSDKEHVRYSLEIFTPPGNDPFKAATTLIIQAGEKEIARSKLVPGVGFDINGEDLTAAGGNTTSFRVQGVDAAGNVVAYGQSPTLELSLENDAIGVFVQKPGTFATAPLLNLVVPLKEQAAVAVEAPPVVSPASAITLALFGTGEERRTTKDQQVAAGLSNRLYIFNPLSLSADEVGTTGPGMGAIYRTGATALARTGGRAFIFGGRAREMPTTGDPTYSSEMDVVQVARTDFADFTLTPLGSSNATDPQVAREGAPLASLLNGVFAFGGRRAEGPLDSIVTFDLTDPRQVKATLLAQHLMAARSEHTVTAVGGTSPEILIFGGAAPGGPVAELFSPPAGMQEAKVSVPAGDPGPARKGHVAVSLPGDPERVLIIGGADETNQPIASSVIYSTKDRTLDSHGPVLQIPRRRGLVAFVLGNDLVVAGGEDASGNPVGKAELFDARSLEPVGVVDCLARSGATVTVLPHGYAVLVGGEVIAMGGTPGPTNQVELYQPRRLTGTAPGSTTSVQGP